MSSVLKVAVTGGQVPKTVLHEREKSTMGTKCAGSGTRIAIKRNVASKQRITENESNSSRNILVRGPVRDKPNNNENDCKKNVLNEKRRNTQTAKAEKGKTENPVLSNGVRVNSLKLTVSVNSYESVTDENIIAEDNRRTDFEVAGVIATSNDKDVKSSELSKAHSSDTGHKHVNTDSTSLTHKTSNTEDSEKVAKHQDITHMSSKKVKVLHDVSLPENVGTKSRLIPKPGHSKGGAVTQTRTSKADVKIKTVPSSSSVKRKELPHKCSIPKPLSVILDSCDSKQIDFEMPDKNKDTVYCSNKTKLMQQDCTAERDEDHNEIAIEVTQGKCRLSYNETIKQTSTLTATRKLSEHNINNERKMQKATLPDSIPNYLRMTSSASNKEIKKKSEKTSNSKQRSVTHDNHSKSDMSESHKSVLHLNRNESNYDSAQKVWQSGLRSSVNTGQTKTKSVSKIAQYNKISGPRRTEAFKSESPDQEEITLPSKSNTNSVKAFMMTDKNEIKTSNSGQVSDLPVSSTRPSKPILKSASQKNSKDITSEAMHKPKSPVQKCENKIVGISSASVPNKVKKSDISVLNLKLDRTGVKHSVSSIRNTAKLSLKVENYQPEVEMSSISETHNLTPEVSSSDTDRSYCSKQELKSSDINVSNQQKLHQDPNVKESINSSSGSNSSTDTSQTSKSLKRLNSDQEPKVKSISKPRLLSISVKSRARNSEKEKPLKVSSRPGSVTQGTSSYTLNSKSNIESVSKQTKYSVKSQKDFSLNRDSNSRSRSNTPGSIGASSDIDTCSSKKTISSMKQNTSKKDREEGRDSNSRSRSTTPGSVSSISSSSNVSRKSSEKPINSRKKVDSMSRTTTPDAATVLSASNNTSDSKQTKSILKEGGLQKVPKLKKDNKCTSQESSSITPANSQKGNKALSRKSTSGTSSSSDSSASTSKQKVSCLKQTKPKTDKEINNRDPNSRSRSSTPGMSSSSSEKYHHSKTSVIKPTKLSLKRQTSQKEQKDEKESPVRARPLTPVASSKLFDIAAEPTTSRRQNSKVDLESNRKSRSRSSTPGVSLSPRDSKGDHSLAEHKISRKTNSQSISRQKKTGLHNTVAEENLAMTRNYSSDKKSNGTTVRKKERTPDSNHSHLVSASCERKNNTKYMAKELSDSNKTKQLPIMKTKIDVNSKRLIQNKPSLYDNGTCDTKKSLQREQHSKSSGSSFSEQAKTKCDQSKELNSSTAPAQSSLTKLNSRQQVKESCNSFTILSNIPTSSSSGNKKSELLRSQNICSNKTQVLSPTKSDNPIVKSTKLSIKSDSRIKAGNVNSSLKTKITNSLQTSPENRSRLQRGGTLIQKKVNKTLVSDNKSRKTASLSVIKRDNISTKPCNNSGKKETRKQNSQLPGNLTLSDVNFESETESVSISDELIGVDSCLIKKANELVGLCGSDNLNSDKIGMSTFERTEHIHPEFTSDENGISKISNSDRINYHGNSNQLLENLSSSPENIIQSEGIECSWKKKNIGYTAFTLGKYKSSSNAKCRDMISIDREATARDPKSKVNSNCLSDVRENEIQPINCGAYIETACIQNKTENIDFGMFTCTNRKHSMNDMDITPLESKTDTELICVHPDMEYTKDTSCLSDTQFFPLCNLCTNCPENFNIFDKMKNEKRVGFESRCILCGKDISVENINFKYEESCSKEEKDNRLYLKHKPEKSVMQNSQNFSCQADKLTENSTFEIDTRDVNSSNQMPIIDGCAFKHTKFSDSQKDKTECTDVVPVTGATNLQTTNKRQDKKIVPLLNCEKRNSVLCSNKNGLVHISDTDIVADMNFSCKSAAVDQSTNNIEKGQDHSCMMTSDGDKLITSDSGKGKLKNVINEQKYCEGSLVAAPILSDWQKSELFDRIPSENESKLQVLNNCEINKGTSEPENSCGKWKGDDNLSRDNMYEDRKENERETDATGMCSHSIKCSEMCDLNAETNERTENVGHQEKHMPELNCVALKEESCNSVLKDIDDNTYAHSDIENDINFCEDDKESSSTLVNLQPNLDTKGHLVEETRQKNTLTFVSENGENINYHENENSLPERDLRTNDAKQINTEHDLSFHAPCQCKNISQDSSEIGHTGLELISDSESCECKQYHFINDESFETVSNCAEGDISATLPIANFLQNQLSRLSPDVYLSETELKNHTTGKPYVLGGQEKQANCFDFGNDSWCLFSQRTITEDEITVDQCKGVKEFQQLDNCTPDVGQSPNSQNKGNTFDTGNTSTVLEGKRQDMDNFNHKHSEQHSNKCSFSSVPKLSECICEMYPNLISKNKKCSDLSNEKEINHEDIRCSNMTQNANFNTCSFNMKLNDSACLFQSYKHSDSDDIKVSTECSYCTDLSQTSENISNSDSKILHSQNDLSEVNSAEHGSLKNTGNKLCTGSIPCDGSKVKISTHLNRSKSTEYQDISDLSSLFDDREDTSSCGTMSRDHSHVATPDTVLSSELSAELTDIETLKTHNPSLYQDGFEDKPSGELSAVKITTQKSSCNLMFSEKSNEPKDLTLRYEHKNSAGHKKFYSCKDELDTGIASAQEENYFRNLAANRDEDINCEIKLNNLNLETPTYCDYSSLESENSDLEGNQGQSFRTEANSSTVGDTKHFELHDRLNVGHYNSKQGRGVDSFSQEDKVETGTKLSPDQGVLDKDIRLYSDNLEQCSDEDYRHYPTVENGFLQESSIKSDICQTEGEVNGKLALHKEESISKLNLPGQFIYSVPCAEFTEYNVNNQKQINDDLCEENDVLNASKPCCALELQNPPEQNIVTNTENIPSNDVILPENIKNVDICKGKQPSENIHESPSALDDVLSDTSEAFTDAEERLISPFTDNTVCITHPVANGKDFNVSCAASTSTESFVDAVESLDDEYLTSTNFRHSREFQNEEILSQISSSTDDSSTSIAGSMDDLSGWEEFSENIVDLNDYNGDMESKRFGMTNIEGISQHSLPDGQAHAPICISKHVFHDKNYQSPSPSSETSEIYLSKIKTNNLRYKDTRYGTEQKVIGNSIFETGNGSIFKDTDVNGLRTESRIERNTQSQNVGHCGQSHGSSTLLHKPNITKSDSTVSANISGRFREAKHENQLPESTFSQPASAVDTKIETAVIKRTQRRRRRQIEQQKVSSSSDSNNKDKSEIDSLCSKHGEKSHDNESIEKSSCSHSQHSIYSCTVSDNMTSHNEPTSGTQELSQQVNTNSNLNEFNLDRSGNSGTPLNYDYGDYLTKEASICEDKTDNEECIFTDRENETVLTTGEIQIDEIRKFKNNDYNELRENNGDADICQTDAKSGIADVTEIDKNNDIQLTIEFEENVKRKDADFDDIEFIDADDTVIELTEIEHTSKEINSLEENENESNHEKQISPVVSFTFSFGENNTGDRTEVCADTTEDFSKSISQEQHTSCVETVIIVESDVSTRASEEIPNQDQVHPTNLAKGGVKDESISLEQLEVTYETKALREETEVEDLQKDNEVCKQKEEVTNSMNLKVSCVDSLQESQQNSTEISMHADICEESNISVRHALELEKQSLADTDESRSRKSLFISKRSGRRATIESCSFENKTEDEKKDEVCNDNEIMKNAIKKSNSFRVERKQVSPMASFMNPPELSDTNESDSKDTSESMNKKVSDMCKSFMTKTRASAQRTRAKTLSKSPAPQRKLMKWVNNQGKWMRIPVDETQGNKDDTKNNQILVTNESVETHNGNCKPINLENSDKTVTAPGNEMNDENQRYKELPTLRERNLHIPSVDLGTNSGTESEPLEMFSLKITKPFNKEPEFSRQSTEAVQTTNENETPPSPKLNKESTCSADSHDIDVKFPPEAVPPVNHFDDDNESKPDVEQNVDLPKSVEKTNMRNDINSTPVSISNTNDIKVNENTEAAIEHVPSEASCTSPDTELEIRVIGTTLDDAQCDQEKHLKRQELLFGLLDNYNRRKPRRFSHHESKRNVQNAVKSQCKNVYANIVETTSTDRKYTEEHENIPDNPKCIPKIKAVKIQEEVFECKTEYLKDTNINQLPKCDINIPDTKIIERKSDKEENIPEKVIDFKALKLPIKKSKTFSGLGDIERQKHAQHRHIDNAYVQSKTGDKPTVTLKKDDCSINVENNNMFCNKNDTTGVYSVSRMTDKRSKAGLKLNLEKAHTRVRNDLQSDASPVGLRPEQSRGRSSGDKSPNRLCVDQPKVRLRSPEKGPRQIQRSKLLSEIVEVEENKDDVSVTCDRRQPQRYYSDRQRQEGQKPVKRSNKRRSLSLPTGTLAFGDARIVYKNGHFTIETMDNSEYDSQPSDYHSSSRHLDGHVDEMWEMPDTGGDYSRVKSDSREVTDMHNKPLMRRQNAKTVLHSSDSTEDVFYNETEFAESMSSYKSNLKDDSKVLNMGQTSDEVFNESCSSRTSDMSVDSYSSEIMDLSTDDSVTDFHKLSSSSIPEAKDQEVKRVMQRAKRTSSFRAAQEGGSLRLSGIEEDQVHNSTRARSVSLDESQNSDLNKFPKTQSVQNQNATFLKKVMAKRKTLNENLNISGFSKQSESAKEFFSKKMTLKGLFRKNKSDTAVNSPMKTEHPVSPPIATFQDDDIGSVDTPPGSPYRKSRDLRRRHTSADILKSYPDSSETDSNCPTPTQERSNKSRHSVSSPSTPSHEANSFLNLSSHSAPQFRDDDEMSITSASSFASSIHSPPLEQPHKPKTPKPVGASPRRNPSVGSQLSRSGSQSSQRNVMNSVTSLESDHSESFQEDTIRDPRCECSYRSEEQRYRMLNRNVRGSADSLNMCQFCKQMEIYKNDSAFASSSCHKQQLTSKDKLRDESARLRKDSSERSNYDRLGIISQADVASSNSNDSGIQRDASLHSSNESIKGTSESRIRLRRNKSLSPHPDRPKSEISVRWADGDSGDYDLTETTVKLRNKSSRDRPRPKSDLDGSSFLSERLKAFGSEINLQPYCSLRSLYEMKRHDLDRQKNRRMSTPHPIKSRLQRAPQKLHKQPPLVRSSSMPESLEKIHKRRKMHHLLDYHLDSLSRHMDIDDLSDESDLSFDQASLQERSLSVQSSSSHLTAMDEDEDNLTYAEALWDHITMDPEELGFRAQDVIEVLDMADKDWWFGVIDDREGWFPATFVRIRVNQDQLDDDLDLDTTIQGNLTTSPKLRRISMFNKNQARSNVVNEIINAEREYVKHLKDVVEGYIQHARKRTEMFPEERISLIFGNIEKIYSFAQKFVSQLEMCIDVCPHLSEIGQCFLQNERGFEIYSDYCNNHPSACEELDELCKDSKYKHFFEACRLLQELVEIPLEGFLLTPVQKICKYPLQLAELLKYTPPDHPDYMMVKDALAAMRKIATLINERKRKMESIEKIAVWQHSVVDWEGPDLLDGSSELIFSGELNKINTAGWSQERFFFLFDHQVVYCKKELLKRHVFSYKGRIDLDHCDIVDVPDGKDSQYNVTVKHGWKFHDTHRDKWFLVYAKSEAVKQSWLKAIRDERQRVLEDQENDFCVPDHWKHTVLNKVRSQSHLKDKQSGGRTSHGQLLLHKDLKDFTYATLPRHRISQKHDKKKGWFKFGGGKKSKR